MSDRRPENSDQMVEAVQRQMAHAQRSAYVDRGEWTDDQWIADARRLMNDIDGAITSLVNGHVMAMLRRLDELTEPEGDCAEDCQRHASCRDQVTVPPEGLVKVWVEDEEFGEHWQASIRPADLIAVVRRGVESGTIKGEVAYTRRGTYLVIPISDEDESAADTARQAVEELTNKPLREGPVDGGFRPGAEVDSVGEVSDSWEDR